MEKVKLHEIVNGQIPFSKLAQLSAKGELKFSASFKLEKWLKRIEEPLKDYHEQREKIIDKFGERFPVTKEEAPPDYQGDLKNLSRFMPKKGKEKEFEKYLKMLNDYEVELLGVKKFRLEDLENITDFTVQDQKFFEPFVEDVEPDKSVNKKRKPIEIKFDETEEKGSEKEKSKSK